MKPSNACKLLIFIILYSSCFVLITPQRIKRLSKPVNEVLDDKLSNIPINDGQNDEVEDFRKVILTREAENKEHLENAEIQITEKSHTKTAKV